MLLDINSILILVGIGIVFFSFYINKTAVPKPCLVIAFGSIRGGKAAAELGTYMDFLKSFFCAQFFSKPGKKFLKENLS